MKFESGPDSIISTCNNYNLNFEHMDENVKTKEFEIISQQVEKCLKEPTQNQDTQKKYKEVMETFRETVSKYKKAFEGKQDKTIDKVIERSLVLLSTSFNSDSNPTTEVDFSSLESPEKNDEWIRLSVMKPADVLDRKAKGTLTPKEIAFLRNIHFGLYSVFDPWFTKSGFWKNQSFAGMLKSQHSNSITGRDGVQYGGFTPALYGVPSTTDIRPGSFRHEITRTKNEFVQDQGMFWKIETITRAPPVIQINLIVADVISPSERLKQISQSYVAKEVEDKVDEIPANKENGLFLDMMGRPNVDKHYVLDTIKLPGGIELDHGIYNKIFEKTMIHSYPEHADQKILIEHMGKIIEQIRKLSDEVMKDHVPLNEKTRSHALDLIEQYLYLGIHTHMFEGVNFSIIMGQTNYMLDRFGFKGIGPSKIDYIGLLEQFPEFRTAFREQLKEANSKEVIDQLEIVTMKSPILSVVAHIQDFGDRVTYDDQIIKHPSSNEIKRIEEVMLHPVLPKDLELESRGIVQAGKDSASYEVPWKSNQSVGTREQSRGLEELAFRLKSKSGVPLTHSIRYQAKFGDDIEWSKEFHDGESCRPVGEGRLITQLKVWITKLES